MSGFRVAFCPYHIYIFSKSLIQAPCPDDGNLSKGTAQWAHLIWLDVTLTLRVRLRFFDQVEHKIVFA